jgi:hypothetical protein
MRDVIGSLRNLRLVWLRWAFRLFVGLRCFNARLELRVLFPSRQIDAELGEAKFLRIQALTDIGLRRDHGGRNSKQQVKQQ